MGMNRINGPSISELEARALDLQPHMDEALQTLSPEQIPDCIGQLGTPMKAVATCSSKGQLQTLCFQLTMKNMALQRQVLDLKTQIRE
jgi:hypothetical protein